MDEHPRFRIWIFSRIHPLSENLEAHPLAVEITFIYILVTSEVCLNSQG